MRSEKFDAGIWAIARKLSYGDRFLAEELRDEMHVAILEMQEGQEEGYYFRSAKNKAIDYIKSKKNNYSYGNVVKHISLEAMMVAGIQIDTDGVLSYPGHFQERWLVGLLDKFPRQNDNSSENHG